MPIDQLLDSGINVKDFEMPETSGKSVDFNVERDVPDLDNLVAEMVEKYRRGEMEVENFMENALAARILNSDKYSDLITTEDWVIIEEREGEFFFERSEELAGEDYGGSSDYDLTDISLLKHLLDPSRKLRMKDDSFIEYDIRDFIQSGFENDYIGNPVEYLMTFKVLYPDEFSKLSFNEVSQLLRKGIKGWMDNSEGEDWGSRELLSEAAFAALIDPSLVKEIVSQDDFEKMKSVTIKKKNLVNLAYLAIIASESAIYTPDKGLVVIPQKLQLPGIEVIPIPEERRF